MSLSETLANAIVNALNSDVPAEDCMKALRETENNLAAFMLENSAAHEFMAIETNCTHH